MSTRRTQRGAALLEAMIGLSVLLTGLIGLFQMQIIGITANQGARAHMRAAELARDLQAGMERWEFTSDTATTDVRLTPNASGSTAPAYLRTLTDGTAILGSSHSWTELNATDGVIPDADIERDPGTALPLYQRRWVVWDYVPAGGGLPATKIIGISVTYKERRIQTVREVMLYSQRQNPGVLNSALGASR